MELRGRSATLMVEQGDVRPDCGGFLVDGRGMLLECVRGGGPELARDEMSPFVPLVSPSSPLSASSPLFDNICRSAGDADGGSGLGLGLLTMVEANDVMERSPVLGDAAKDRGSGAALGLSPAGSAPSDSGGVQAKADELVGRILSSAGRFSSPNPVSSSPPSLCAAECDIANGGMAREEGLVSPMAREAMRPQPTDGLRALLFLMCLEEAGIVNTSRRYGKSQGSGENRRRDDDEEAPEEEAEDENEGNQDDFGGKSVIDEATIEGESGSDDQFYDARVEVEEPMMKHRRQTSSGLHLHLSRKIKNLQESTPRVLLAEKLNF
ncbi:hypothetical protein Dimus_003036 [Dionaea muscipula]